MSNITPNFKPSIFRFDQPIILANPIGKKIIPGYVNYASGNYDAGTVVARNTTSGYYQAYVNGGASGTGVAAGVLLDAVDFGTATGGQQIARVCIAGTLFYDKLVGIDSDAITDLLARKVVLPDGTNLLTF